MPPKAKGGAKAKAKAHARAKAGAAMRVAPLRHRGRGVLRRPAGHPGGEGAPVPRELWKAGSVLQAEDVPLVELAQGVEVVVQEGSYFNGPCRVAGIIRGVEVDRDACHVLLQATGTDCESLLRHCSGAPKEQLRGHLCGVACTGDRVADNLVHIKRLRLAKPRGEEDHWCRNLEAVEIPAADDLRDLREKRADLNEEKKKEKSQSRGKDRSRGRRKKEKKKERSPGKKKRKRSRTPSRGRQQKDRGRGSKERKAADQSSSTSSMSIRTDGTTPRGASSKALQALFAGTGLDKREKVQRRVARKARRVIRRKKTGRGGSTSRSSSTERDEEIDFGQEEGFFEGATKVQRVAESCPGALGARSLTDMRRVLLQGAGLDEQNQLVTPTAIQYFRQELQRKSTGPVARELLTICTAVDWLLRGRAAQAVDCLLQRVKSVEATMSGSHWSVSQRLEIPPMDLQTIAPREELMSAQKAAAEDAKTRHLASLPDGRSRGKGQSKAKEGAGQEAGRRDRDRGKGKGSGKQDKGKKREEEAK